MYLSTEQNVSKGFVSHMNLAAQFLHLHQHLSVELYDLVAEIPGHISRLAKEFMNLGRKLVLQLLQLPLLVIQEEQGGGEREREEEDEEHELSAQRCSGVYKLFLSLAL